MGERRMKDACLASLAVSLCLGAVPHAAAVQPNMKLYLDEFPGTPLVRLGATKNPGQAPMSSLTSQGYANAPALESAAQWDFSGASVLAGVDVIQQSAPIAPGWSCYIPDPAGCGVALPNNDLLLVQDNLTTLSRDVTALDFNGTDRYLLRAQIFDEGGTPQTSAAENRICFDPASHPDVPFLVFPDTAGARRYMAVGDPLWQSAVFNCPVSATQDAPCGAAGGQSGTFAADARNNLLGRVTGEVRGTGTMTLPSGHVLDAMVVRLHISFNVQLACFINGAVIQNFRLVWLVPNLGPVVQVLSALNESSFNTWNQTSAAYVGYGLLPPLSLTAPTTTATSISVAWDPGRITSFVDGYVVHWGTTSNAPTNASPLVPVGTNTYTINGLAPNTTYYVSVSSVKSYRDPKSGVTTEYHSVERPTIVGADADGDTTMDPDHTYPPEISAVTVAGGADELSIWRQVTLTGTGPNPPLAGIWPTPSQTIPGALPIVVALEGNPSGTNSVWFYRHSSAIQTMKVAKLGTGLIFLPN